MKKTTKVEPSYLDGFPDDVHGPLDFLNFLDFPMESLEDDAGNWDDSKSHYLGPIPTDVDLTLVPQYPIGNAFPDMMPAEPNAPVGDAGEAQESGLSQIHSPVSVLDSSGSCSVRKCLPIKSDLVIPVRIRSKRARPSNLNPWFLMPPILSSARKMVRSRKNKEKKKKVLPISLVKITDDSFQHTEEELLNASDATEKKDGSLQRSVAVKKCTHCEVTKTPQWREGPMGPKTLCNACGVRYRSGRLFPEYRPAASPTFVPTLHSNSHKKVIEMRKKANMQETAILSHVPVSPLPEFVPVSGSPFDLSY